jgi:hypothetical protein
MIPAALLMVLAALLVPLSPRGKTMPIMTVSAAAIEVVPKDSYQEHQHRLLQDQREDLQQQDRRALNSSLVCNLIASVDEATEEKEFKCEDDDSGIVYSIENFSSDFEDLLLRTPERLYSGIQLDIRGAYISQDGQRFVIPHEATVGFPTSITNDADASAGTTVAPNRRRRLYRNESGAKTFLVVYVRDASGGKPDKNPSGFSNSIEDDVFGTHGDTLNLANVVRSTDYPSVSSSQLVLYGTVFGCFMRAIFTYMLMCFFFSYVFVLALCLFSTSLSRTQLPCFYIIV